MRVFSFVLLPEMSCCMLACVFYCSVLSEELHYGTQQWLSYEPDKFGKQSPLLPLHCRFLTVFFVDIVCTLRLPLLCILVILFCFLSFCKRVQSSFC
jgi:hypothetical protein